MEKLRLNLANNGYDIFVGNGLLNGIENLLALNRKVLIVTDENIPLEYISQVAKKCLEHKIVTVKCGEDSKSFETLQTVLTAMCEFNMERSDCVVAIGGGVVGDLAGFASSCYMRGLDFYNVPTTVLSQVDSSIGGKTAINFSGVKNIVGAFYQPKCVVIDTDLLKTLPKRQLSNGLAEAVKMSLTSDKALFEYFEQNTYDAILKTIEKVILACLNIKKAVVEQDEKEAGLRKVLNFGHTVGHAIEIENRYDFYHGECVALGMLAMCSDHVKNRLVNVLEKLQLPVTYKANPQSLIQILKHDKKMSNGKVSAVWVEKIGEYSFQKMTVEQIEQKIKQRYKGE